VNAFVLVQYQVCGLWHYSSEQEEQLLSSSLIG